MAIGEAQLATWSAQGSVTQSADTHTPIRTVLENANAPYNKSFETYLQGSYGNDTNVYSESDVDIVMQTNALYYYDISRLSEEQQAAYKAAHGVSNLSQPAFKAEVTTWLQRHYNGVVAGDKAITVPGNGNRREADVLACAQFRRYFRFSAGEPESDFARGICFHLPDGTRIENFPKQHSANCTTKHQNTSSRFKPQVRIWKNLRNRMVADGKIAKGLAPSYFIEGMLWNVPNDQYVNTYGATFVNCLNWVQAADKTKLTTASGFHWLSRDNSHTCWPTQDMNSFLTAVTQTWNNWR